MAWTILRLREHDADLARLPPLAHVAIGRRVGGLAANEDLAPKLESFLRGGPGIIGLDRLATSEYPPSLILRVHGDYRATAWCHLPSRRLVLTHVFRRAHDPGARRALTTHEARLSRYVPSLMEFVRGAPEA